MEVHLSKHRTGQRPQRHADWVFYYGKDFNILLLVTV